MMSASLGEKPKNNILGSGEWDGLRGREGDIAWEIVSD